MKTARVGTLASVTVMLVVANALAQEKKIKRSELPAAVEKTLAAQSKGPTIRGFSKETEHGQTYYETEMVVNGHGKDVLIDETGAIVEVEEEVAINSLSPAVMDGLQAKAGAGKINKVESITKHKMDNVLAGGTKSGYTFAFTAGAGTPSTGYSVTANPVNRGTSGQRGFFTDQSGVIRYDPTTTATSTSSPLQ